MNESLINIINLTKTFPVGKSFFTALKSITLTIGKGEFTGLIGPSGSGKTTLLNIIGTLDNPSSGDAIVLGKSVSNLSAKEAASLRKKDIGFIFQNYNLLPVHTVFENVEFPLLLLKYEKNRRQQMVEEALEWVGLSDKIKSRPSQLSGGESQRVAIARAMVKRPSLVLADEPTANLDAKNSFHVLDTMKHLNEKLGVSFLFATHDDKVIQYLGRIVELNDGEIASDSLAKLDLT